MLDFLLDAVSDSPATYLLLVAIVFVDDFIPFAPGDSAMIAAGVIAANGGLDLYLVIAAGALGGFAGDNLFYLLGRRFGPRVAGWLVRGERSQHLYDEAKEQIAQRGATIVIVGRFIPGGRAITTFASGTVSFPYRRFALADGVAALAWATYAALLGFVGGNAFRDAFWQPLLIGLALAAALGFAAELLRRRRASER